MQPELRLTEAQWTSLDGHLLQDHDEHAAVLLCGVAQHPSGAAVLVCREVVLLGDQDVVTGATGLHLEVSPIALARLAKRARGDRLSMVVAHSHPFGGPVHPSPIDLVTEEELCGRVLASRLGLPVGGLVVGPDGASLRFWEHGAAQEACVRVVGRTTRLVSARSESAASRDTFDRQVRLWGEEGQHRISTTRFAVIGVGGTGSHVVAQLAHLGAQHLLLIDPDRVEESNLSRIIGATMSDVGRPKVEVASSMIKAIRPDAVVRYSEESILELDPTVLLEADIVVCCTDGHGSRHLLTEIAQQYLVPVVDMGIEVQPGASSSRAGGGVRVLRPGEACLHCMRVLDGALVREEFLSDEEREQQRRLGYLRSVASPAPAVVALNGVIASLAVIEVCNLLTGVFAGAPARIVYSCERRSTRSVGAESDVACYVCGADGLLGLGSARALPRRQPRAG